MPINPAYSAGEIPGQPALTPSPLEDAFRVLASYVEGGQKYRQEKKKTDQDMLKTYLDMGALDVDLSGGLSAPKYTPVPMYERPAYLEGIAKAGAYQAGAQKDLAEASALEAYAAGEGRGKQAGGSVHRAKAQFQSQVSTWNRSDKMKFRAAMANPMERQRMKDALVKSYGIHAVEAGRWLEEQLNGL